MAKFSIVIPTRRRPDTFVHTLKTVTAEPDPELEIVVQNNGADPATRAAVEAARDPRIAYEETAEVLPMTRNWERALARARGAYVSVLGDDDGLLPGALGQLRAVLGPMPDIEPGVEVVQWTPPDYGWPGTTGLLADRLVVTRRPGAPALELADSDVALGQLYRREVNYLVMPMIYNSFVAQSVIAAARTRFGSYFATELPDIASAVVNLALTRRFARLERPLTVRGASRHSIGAAFGDRQGGAARRAQFDHDNAALGVDREPGLPASAHVEVVVANALLAARRRILPERADLAYNFAGLAARMIDMLPLDPEGYGPAVADLYDLAAMHGLAIDWAQLPRQPAAGPQPFPVGDHRLADGTAVTVVDGTAAGLATIVDACRLVAALLDGAPASA